MPSTEQEKMNDIVTMIAAESLRAGRGSHVTNVVDQLVPYLARPLSGVPSYTTEAGKLKTHFLDSLLLGFPL